MTADRHAAGRSGRLLHGLLLVAAAGAVLLSALLVGLDGSPLGYLAGGAAGPGIAAAAAAAVLALISALLWRRRRRLICGLLVAAAAGCSLIHGCALDRPYRIEPHVISGDDVSIAGDLYVPDGAGPFAAVVVVPGSAGSQPVTRDSQFGLYRAAADKFARAGIAAFVYDRRGSGESSGDRRGALLTDHAADVAAIQRRLAADPRIRSEAIGTWSISAGTWVAALAAREEPAAFVVLVSAPAVSEGRQRLYEWSQRLAADGLDADDIERLLDLRWRIWSYLATGRGYDQVKSDYQAARRQRWWPDLDEVVFPRWLASAESAAQMDPAERRWFTTDMTRDPIEVLDASSPPVLAVYGGRDEVIPMPQSLHLMQSYADRAGPRVTVRTYALAHHPLVELTFPPRFPTGYWPGTIDWVRRHLD